jgi:hypothetical protein
MDDPRYRQAHEDLTAFWDSIGVSNVDLLETFEDYSIDRLIVSRRDTYPNAEAHALAAEAIERLLLGNEDDSYGEEP